MLTVAIGFPLFLLVNTGQTIAIVLAVILAQAIVHDMLAGVQGAYFSELFNTRTRLSGASLGYQFSASVSGFFAGQQAQQIGLGYRVEDSMAGRTVNGAAAFNQTSLTPANPLIDGGQGI